MLETANSNDTQRRHTSIFSSAWLVRANLLIVFVIIVVVASLLSANFLTVRNVTNLLQQSSLTGIMSIGMTFVILTAGIDLSVGSAAAFAGMVVALSLDSQLPVPVAILITLGVGVFLGLLQGSVSAWVKLPSFIVTLAGLTSIRGLAYMSSDGKPVGSGFPAVFNILGGGYIGIFPVMGLFFIGITILAALILRYTTFGEYVYAVGSNEEAARLSGVPVRMVQITVFGVSGLTAAIAGILLTSQLTIGQPTSFNGAELDAIAAVVLGGTSLFGGRGGVGGTFIAVLLLTVIRNLFNLMGVGSFAQMVVTGLIIVVALVLNRFLDLRAKKNRS